MAFIHSPGNPLVPDTAPTAEAPKPETKTDTTTAPPVEKGPSLAEQIRAERAEREARTKREAEETSTKKQMEDLQTKVGKFEKGKDNILLDSVSFLRDLGLSDKEIALVAENAMYGLVPDKAPGDYRARMVEAQYKRDKQLAEERTVKDRAAAEEQAKKHASEAGARLEQEYQESLKAAIPSLSGNPTSAEWFGQDHDDYTESLFHTARNLAVEATRAGKRADLSPANVAAVLESHLHEKVTRIGTPKQAAVPAAVSKKTETQVSVPPVKLPVSNDKQVTKALPSDEERVRRAAAVCFLD